MNIRDLTNAILVGADSIVKTVMVKLVEPVQDVRLIKNDLRKQTADWVKWRLNYIQSIKDTAYDTSFQKQSITQLGL